MPKPQTHPSGPSRTEPRAPTRAWCALAVVVAALAATALSIRGGYSVWDDLDNFLGSPFRDETPARAVAQILGGTVCAAQAYYPVFHLSLGVDALLFDSRPAWSHAFNVLLHGVNALLAWFVFRLVMREEDRLSPRTQLGAATLAAVLFAVHPLNVEPAAWASGRKVLLAFAFAMLSFLLAARKNAGRLAWACAVVCCALAVLSNALALSAPVLIAAWMLRRGERNRKSLSIRLIPLFAVAVAAIAIRLLGRSAESALVENVAAWKTLNREISNFLAAQPGQAFRVFVPLDLLAVYPFRFVPAWDANAWSGAVLLVCSLTLCAALRRSKSLLPRLAAWGILWHWIALAPTFAHHHHQADRHFYFAGLGTCLFFGALCAAAMAKEGTERSFAAPLAATLAFAVVLTLTAASIRQCAYWRDDLALFGHAARRSTGNVLAHNNYGLALYRSGRAEEGIREFEAALAVDPNYVDALINVGRAFSVQGRVEKAVDLFSRAAQLAPGLAQAHEDLGRALYGLGAAQKSIDALRRAADLDPRSLGARLYLGRAFLDLERPAEASVEFEEAARLAPKNIEAIYGIGMAALAQNDAVRAKESFEKTLGLAPDWPYGLSGLARAHQISGDAERALSLYRKALGAARAGGDRDLETQILAQMGGDR